MFHYLHSSIPRANRSETYSTNILSNVSYGGTRETLYTELKIFPFSRTGSVSEIYGLSCITGHHDDHIIIISSGKNHKKKNTTVQDGKSVRARAPKYVYHVPPGLTVTFAYSTRALYEYFHNDDYSNIR